MAGINGGASSSPRGVLFDVDGTLVLGDRDSNGYNLLPGAGRVIAELRRRKVPFACLTNGSGDTPQEYVEKLRAAGLDIALEEMWTPAVVAAWHLVSRGVKSALVLGMPGVWKPLQEAGIAVHLPDDAPAAVDAVLVGWHPDVLFPHLIRACDAVDHGAQLYVTSAAIRFATHRGPAIGVSGALITMITKVTGRRATVVGKPARMAMRAVAARMGVAPRDMIVVGDDPSLEIAMARAAGAQAVAVLTGLADRAGLDALPESRRPHHVFSDVGGLLGTVL